jgi:hypothetical protein
MNLDLANGYQRKDSASASNVYYGYAMTQNPADTDLVWSIRKINTAASVETVSWANGEPAAFSSSWSGRTSSFATPTGTLGLTWSFLPSNPYNAKFTWNPITGVNRYLITVSNNGLLNRDGSLKQGPYITATYTSEYINQYTHVQSLGTGTFSVTVTAMNVAGSLNATASITLS